MSSILEHHHPPNHSEILDMSSILEPPQTVDPSSIPEIPCSEADQRKDFRSARLFGDYDHFAFEKRMEMYRSSISGSKSKDPKADQENRKCSYCSHEGHNCDECMLRIATKIAFDEAEANRARPRKCEMCKGDHDILHCEKLIPFRYKEDSKNDDEPDYSPKSPTYSSNEEKETKVRTREASICAICYKKHDAPCPYWGSVPEGEPVSPFFPIICDRCDEPGIDNSLWCPYCRMKTSGYVNRRINCMICGKDMSPDCCPYGALVGKKPKIGYVLPPCS